MKAFCSDSGLILSDQLLLPNETFTHLSERWHSLITSWLDHCISTSDGHSAIVNMEVLYANSCTDHIPITMDVCISNIPVLESNDNDNEPEMYKVDWRVISDADKELYSLNYEALLRNVCIPTEALSCKNTSCSNVQHRTGLNVFYAQLIGCLSEASRQLSRKCKRYVSQPGWNEHVADLHKTARDAFVMWANCGKPRQGSEFDLMRQSRACFKYALRAVKTHESSLRKQSLANKLSLSQPNQFWNEIRAMGGKHLSLPSCIEGVTGKRNVCNVWKNHFERILNCIQDEGIRDFHADSVYSDDIVVNQNDVAQAIQALSVNKAAGLDGIFAEHLLYCSNRMHSLLAMCLTGFFVHGHLPDSMLAVVLVPIIKDRAGRIDQLDNYRPIALASVLSKIVESIILSRISMYLQTLPNQFGFKSKLGTDTCIYVLKEIIDNYCRLNGCTFMCFLDASKAFDRVKHSVLFGKLVNRGIPGYIVTILCYWYSRQTMCVRWCGCVSSPPLLSLTV